MYCNGLKHKNCKFVFLWDTFYSLFRHLCHRWNVSFGHNTQRHIQTNEQTEDIIMPIADHGCSTKQHIPWQWAVYADVNSMMVNVKALPDIVVNVQLT